MAMPGQFEEVLRRYTQQEGFTYTPAVLSRLSGISKATIVNWLSGEVAKPRHWQDIVKVANVLRLDAAATDALLIAAGHLPLTKLHLHAAHTPDSALLTPWRSAAQLPLALSTTIPSPESSLVGRTDERDALRSLLRRDDVRLITLVGTGGTGKTRLALQVAHDTRDDFAAGVCFVVLGSITDPALVATTIVRALGLSETADQSLDEVLKQALRDLQVLLVLDNFEHLLPATLLLAELLAAAPLLKLLVTSRVVLHLYDEHEFPVSPLPLPDLDHLPALDELAGYAAIELFVQRARSVRPDFVLTAANAPLIAAVCVHADGLPLAIELAATRVDSLSPRKQLDRLDQRLKLLTSGSNRPAHQQTLRATLEWSYNLLDAHARSLFCRLAVFMGGWTAATAEAVCDSGQQGRLAAIRHLLHRAPRHPGVLDILMTLADNSLITRSESADGASRFTMLETIREFAAERLAASGEELLVRQRHATYYLALAEVAEPKLLGLEQLSWLAQLDQEHDNMRAAMGWSLAHGEAALACRFGGALWRFWLIHGHLSEGRRWLEEALALRGSVPEPIQAKAFLGAGRLARQQADLTRAQAYLEAALTLERAHGNIFNIAFLLGSLGVVAYDQRDFAQARLLHEQSLVLRRMLGDQWGIAATLTNLGEVARQQGDEQRATTLQEESLALARELGDLGSIATALLNLAMLVRNHGDYVRATALLEESLALSQQLGEKVDIAECLEGLAGIAAAQSEAERAARLAGAAEIVRQTTGSPLSPADRVRYEQHLAPARAALDTEAFFIALVEGRKLSLGQAVAYALGR